MYKLFHTKNLSQSLIYSFNLSKYIKAYIFNTQVLEVICIQEKSFRPKLKAEHAELRCLCTQSILFLLADNANHMDPVIIIHVPKEQAYWARKWQQWIYEDKFGNPVTHACKPSFCDF